MNSAYRSPSVSSFSSTMPDTSLIVNYRKYQHLSISSTTLGALVMISQVHQEKKELILTIATKHRVLSAKLSCPSTSEHEFFKSLPTTVMYEIHCQIQRSFPCRTITCSMRFLNIVTRFIVLSEGSCDTVSVWTVTK